MSEPVILLVEDSANDEELTLRALRKFNILNSVAVARDGAQALEYLLPGGGDPAQKRPELPQLVLLDLNLPKIGGLEVLRRIRENPRTRLLPVVILTSSKEDNDLFSGYQLGANSYVVKPVDFVQFADAIRQLGLYWLILNQPAPLPRPSGGA